MFLPRHQNAGQNHDIQIGNRCFENVAQFRYSPQHPVLKHPSLISETKFQNRGQNYSCVYSNFYVFRQ
jgi:hypothetical protein